MTQDATCCITLSLAGAASAGLSARLVGEVLTASGALPHTLTKSFPDFFDAELPSLAVKFSLEAGDLFSAEPVDLSALRTGEIVLKPSDRYLEFVTAVASCFDMACDLDLHGWPILSSVGCSTTMADGAAESIRSSGSAK